MSFFYGFSLMLITLKLANVIEASWWIVLIPLYPITLVWIILIVGMVIFGIKVEKTRK